MPTLSYSLTLTILAMAILASGWLIERLCYARLAKTIRAPLKTVELEIKPTNLAAINEGNNI